MKTTKYLIASLTLFIFMATTAKAENGVEGTLGADLVSQYIWRGTDCGSAAIQPTLGIAWKGLSLTAWGSVGITSADDTRELDLTVGYSAGGFNVGVTDYWFSSGNEAAAGRYFLYKNSKTNHLFEGNVGYDFGPLSMQWYTLFAGNDYKANGERAYSSYVELSAPFKLAKCDWTATVGAVPYACSGIYGNANGFAVTNVTLKATKAFNIQDKVDLPVYVALTANPKEQHMYLTFGIAIRPKL